MIEALCETTEELQRFRAAPWPFQQTFLTPLKDLDRFISTFLSVLPLNSGVLSTDLVVFEPLNLLQLMTANTIDVATYYGSDRLGKYYKVILRAPSQKAIVELLEAGLGDTVDFIFLPTPELFALYADHDEYTTFYTSTQPELSRLTSGLEQAGFKSVLGWTRKLSADGWK